MPPLSPSPMQVGTTLRLRHASQTPALRSRRAEPLHGLYPTHFSLYPTPFGLSPARPLSTLLSTECISRSVPPPLRSSPVARQGLGEAASRPRPTIRSTCEARRWKGSRNEAALASLLDEQRAAEQEARRLRSIKWRPADQDEGIASRFVLVLDERTNRLTRQMLAAVLARMDRRNEILLKVGMSSASNASNASGGGELPEMLPLCKILGKKEHFERQKQRAEAANAAERERRRRAGKTVELGWATAAGDLDHRLRKARAVLERGERVSFVIENRRKRTTVPDDVARALIAAIARAMADIPNVIETGREGTLGGTYKVGYGPKAAPKD